MKLEYVIFYSNNTQKSTTLNSFPEFYISSIIRCETQVHILISFSYSTMLWIALNQTLA